MLPGMAGAEWNADSSQGAPTLSAVTEGRQPGPSASTATTASAQVKKVQNSIGACDACRLRKVSRTDASLAVDEADTFTGSLLSK